MRKISPLQKVRLLLLAIGIIAITLKFGVAAGLHFARTAVDFLIIISVIVFVHEFGHYIVAKWAGVKVEIFSLGFGKELWGFNDRSGTRWKISALPLGGYVKMYGDASEASMPMETLDALPEEEKRKTFHFKSLPRKTAIVVAGPMANFVLTTCIYTFFIIHNGLPSTEPVVAEVIKDTPAEAAGLEAGDRILSINGDHVEYFTDIPDMIATNVGAPVTLKILRNNAQLQVTLTPKKLADKDGLGQNPSHPFIGIKAKAIKFRDVGLPSAIWEAARYTYHGCTTQLKAIGQMITGQRSAKEISGPIGIARLSGQATEKGLPVMLWFMAFLSSNLGLINLFPIPMLDGGHLLFYAIEALQGRPLAKRFQEYGFRIGMAMIVLLMAFAIFNDIRNLLV